MNKVLRITLALLLFASIWSCRNKEDLYKKEQKTLNDLRVSLYDAQWNRLMNDESLHRFNGTLTIGQGGEVIYHRNVGYASLEDKAAIDSSSQFPIASLSKQITAAIVLKQVENGNLSLDSKVSSVLKDSKDDKLKQITILQLLNHTSGYEAGNRKLAFQPGSDFLYSNAGYNLLGKIAAKVSGKPFDSLALEIFRECKMPLASSASMYKEGNLVKGYDGAIEGRVQELEDNLEHIASDDIGIPAGGFIMTGSDLVKWNECLHKGKLLREDLYEQQTDSSAYRDHSLWGPIDYGFGIQIVDQPVKEFFHGGYVRGFPSVNLYYPATDVSIIILENVAQDNRDYPYIYRHHVQLRDFARSIEAGFKENQLRIDSLKGKD